jgi:hypothetical protein
MKIQASVKSIGKCPVSCVPNITCVSALCIIFAPLVISNVYHGLLGVNSHTFFVL